MPEHTGLPLSSRAALEQIAKESDITEMDPELWKPLRAERMIYTAWDGQRQKRFAHVTIRGRERLERKD